MSDDEKEKRKERNLTIRSILFVFLMMSIIILWVTGMITPENVNLPEPTKPELQLRWDEFP